MAVGGVGLMKVRWIRLLLTILLIGLIGGIVADIMDVDHTGDDPRGTHWSVTYLAWIFFIFISISMTAKYSRLWLRARKDRGASN